MISVCAVCLHFHVNFYKTLRASGGKNLRSESQSHVLVCFPGRAILGLLNSGYAFSYPFSFPLWSRLCLFWSWQLMFEASESWPTSRYEILTCNNKVVMIRIYTNGNNEKTGPEMPKKGRLSGKCCVSRTSPVHDFKNRRGKAVVATEAETKRIALSPSNPRIHTSFLKKP